MYRNRNYRNHNPKWHWETTIVGVIKLAVMLFVFMLAYRNLDGFDTVLGFHILGYLALFVIGMIIIRHLLLVIQWYNTWRNLGGGFTSIVIHACLYSAVAYFMITSI
jgi:hypothetical protein